MAFEVRSPEECARCVVMLARTFTETERINGREFEVWLKARTGRRPTPKRAHHLGTGFLVTAHGAAFLVTAGHVARRMDREARLVVANGRGAASEIGLAELLRRVRGPMPWRHHPSADVAVLHLRHPPEQFSGRLLPVRALEARKLAPPGLLDLLVVGFPLGLFSPERFTPIAKRVHAASGIVRFCGDEMSRPADFFLLDQPLMGGCSGAPVFALPGAGADSGSGPPLVAVGLVSQTISDPSGGQYAVAVPSAAVLRTLALAHPSRRRPRPWTRTRTRPRRRPRPRTRPPTTGATIARRRRGY
jgi:hypothetical protein